MKKIFYYLIITLFMVAFCGCEESIDKNAPRLWIHDSSISIGQEEGASKTVDIESNTPWSASSDKEWCTISPKNGNGNETITISATENIGDERVAIITVAVSEEIKKTITVTQMGFEVTVSKRNVEIDTHEGASTTVDIESNTSWSASSDKEWCTISPKNGNGNETITISATENIGDERVAIITVSVSDELKKTITVTQMGVGEYQYIRSGSASYGKIVYNIDGNYIRSGSASYGKIVYNLD